MTEGTGACGINCLVCGLMRQGKCSPCASGLEPRAHKKLAAQLSLMGGVCPILQCAVQKKVAYCSADCEVYPCHHFSSGPYPLSQAYLDMQIRRRIPGKSPGGQPPPPRGKGGEKLH